MGLIVRKMKYYKTTISQPGITEAKALAIFSKNGINYLAFNAKVINKGIIEMTFYPEETELFEHTAKENNFKIDGPYSALHIEGDNKTGECAAVFEKLSRANVATSISFGIADINKSYGIVVYVNENDIEKAMKVLE